MNLKLNFGLPTDNIYKLFFVLGVMLYVYSHQFAVSTVKNYEISWLNRTEDFQRLNEIENKEKRSQQWHNLRARDNLDTKFLKRDLVSYILMSLGSILLLGWGGHYWLFKHQPAQDNKDKLELEKLNYGVEQARSASNHFSVMRRIRSLFLK